MTNLKEATEFSKNLVAARKTNDVPIIRDADKEQANIDAIRLCGINMAIKKIKKIVNEKQDRRFKKHNV